jgi:hypothetical protein
MCILKLLLADPISETPDNGIWPTYFAQNNSEVPWELYQLRCNKIASARAGAGSDGTKSTGDVKVT